MAQLDDGDVQQVIIRNFAHFDMERKEYVSDAITQEVGNEGARNVSTPANKGSKLKEHRYLHLGLQDCLMGVSPGMLSNACEDCEFHEYVFSIARVTRGTIELSNEHKISRSACPGMMYHHQYIEILKIIGVIRPDDLSDALRELYDGSISDDRLLRQVI